MNVKKIGFYTTVMPKEQLNVTNKTFSISMICSMVILFSIASKETSTRIINPKNSRENQLDFISLGHEKLFSFSCSSPKTRDWKKKFSFAPWSTRLKERILVLISKIRIPSNFPNELSYYFKKNKEIISHFLWKVSVQLQATNQILKNPRENCLNHDSRFRLEVWDWRELFSVSSWSLRLSARNSRLVSMCNVWIGDILILVLRLKKCF